MARFDVYPSALVGDTEAPYWLDVQADHLSALATRVVVPLCLQRADIRLAERLQPVLEVQGQALFLDTANLATFPKRLLHKPVANLREQRFAIEDALDFLFQGH